MVRSDRQTDRWTDRLIRKDRILRTNFSTFFDELEVKLDRTDRQTVKQSDKQTNRQTDRQPSKIK
jgi:hypothetical protein